MTSSLRSNRIRIICLILSVAGLVLSYVLTRNFYMHILGGRTTGCVITNLIDCDKVSASAYSSIAGIPISVFSFTLHLLFSAIFVSGLFVKSMEARGAFEGIALVLSFTAALVSVALAVVSFVIIKALCIYCVVLQIVNVAIFVILLTQVKGKIGKSIRAISAILSFRGRYVAGIVITVLAVCLGGFILANSMERIGLKSASQGAAALFETYFSQEVYTFDSEDSPRLGSNRMGVRIVVFSDYNCSYCRSLDQRMQSLVHEFDGKIELVYKFFPLDGECNPFFPKNADTTSCEAAAAAYSAYTQGKFWEYSSTLFENFGNYSRSRLLEYAEEVGISDMDSFRQHLDDPEVMRRLGKDAVEGLAAGVDSTPTIFINGRKLETQKFLPGDTRYGIVKATIKNLVRK